MTEEILQQQLADLKTDVKAANDNIARVLDRLVRLETVSERHGALCPYQVDIARASNNKDRLEKLEAAMGDIKVQMARAGFMGGMGGGGAVGILAMLVYGMGKIAGWW